MTVVALERVLLCDPMGDMGDRNEMGGNTFIQSEKWHIEADIHLGSLKDVQVYRNTSVNIRSATPTWEWYAAIPTANIKAYRVANHNPSPSALNAEPQTATPQKAVPGSASAGKA